MFIQKSCREDTRYELEFNMNFCKKLLYSLELPDNLNRIRGTEHKISGY